MLKVKKLLLLNGKKLDFELQAGELMLIQGPNGAGKSLLLKSLARLLPAEYEELSLEGKSSQQWPVEEWRSKLLYLPPEVSFTEEETIKDFLRYPLGLQRYKHFIPSFDPRPFFKDLSLKVHLLSSGQRQQLALLRALSLDFEGLLLDESLTHMDAETRQEMLELLSQFRQRGKMILLVSHFDLHLDDGGVKELKL